MVNPVPPRERIDQPWRSEGAPPSRKMPGGWAGLILTALVVFLAANLLLSFFGGGGGPAISYTEFSKQVKRQRLEDLRQGRHDPGRAQAGGTPS
ncbi:hypothetical protein QFZ67_002143 [Streptomyces sp. V1I1]|nr:hypothetical protein [Streptomyces sp. V1I1]